MNNNNGFTLIETIMSFGILAIILLPTISFFASTITTTKKTQDSISAKYLAEKHMEIVKGSRIDDLVTALTTVGDCDPNETEIIPNGITTCTNSKLGLTVSWSPVRSIDVKNEIDPSDVLILSAADSVLEVIENDGTTSVKTESSIIPIISGDPIKIQLRYPASPPDITVYNKTETKLEIYCVNISPENRDIPQFIIKEGRVAFYDYSQGSDRLPEEAAGNQLPVEYEVTVTVSSDSVYYQMKTIKALPLR